MEDFKTIQRRTLKKRIYDYRYVYLMLIPPITYYIIFKYLPIYGITIAFKDFSMRQGIFGSPWAGLNNFRNLFAEPDFWVALKNTLVISLLKLIIGFPIPVILSLFINEVTSVKLKKISQIIYTFPHFLSWVIMYSLVFNLLSNSGALNNFLIYLGYPKISILTDQSKFRMLLVWSEVWKETGWSTIIYMAAISGIDPTLYEAAKLDGVNRIQKMHYIIWPGIKSIVVTMFILKVGSFMSAGFMQIFNMYNPSVYPVADILDTYVYRITFQMMPDYGLSTAVDFFKGIINFILLLTANTVCKLFGERSIY